MKQLGITLISALWILTVCGCATLRPVNYANKEWHIAKYGHIEDKDTVFRMTFGDVLIPENPTIISCADSAAKYPGMEKFIAEILNTAGLQNDEVLFYSPAHGKIFVRLSNEPEVKRPSSITANMNDERPYTMWIYDDDAEDWHRQPGEMYTYTYFDKKRQRILVVDFYDYGETPIAQIFIFQSRNKKTDKMQMPKHQGWDFSAHNLKNYKKDVEFWSHCIDGHRKNAFANYRLGHKRLMGQK